MNLINDCGHNNSGRLIVMNKNQNNSRNNNSNRSNRASDNGEE